MTTREQLTMTLLQEVSPMLRNFAATSPLDFDDLYQDASLLILTILDKGCQVQNLTSYIVRSVRNRTISKIRRAQHFQFVSMDVPVTNESAATLADLLPSEYGRDPADIVVARERIIDLTHTPVPKRRAALAAELGETALASLEDEDKQQRRECAWCLAEQGLAPGNGSHGICQRHADQVLANYRASRQRREVQA